MAVLDLLQSTILISFPKHFFFWIIIVEYRSSKIKITTKKNNEKREYAGYEARVETRTLTI
jgi:hypothetical protein